MPLFIGIAEGHAFTANASRKQRAALVSRMVVRQPSVWSRIVDWARRPVTFAI